jgi:hypothetical protein
MCRGSRLKTGCSQDWLPHERANLARLPAAPGFSPPFILGRKWPISKGGIHPAKSLAKFVFFGFGSKPSSSSFHEIRMS